GTQLLADAQLLVEKALHFLLLLRAHQERRRVVALGLELREATLGFGKLVLKALLGRAKTQVRLAAQRLDPRERARERRAAAQPDQVRAAGEIVERVHDDVAVARERGQDPLTEEALALYPEPVAQHVDVADQHDVRALGGRDVLGGGGGGRRGFVRRILLVRRGIAVGIARVVVAPGRTVRERRAQRSLETRREHVALAARREIGEELARVGQELEADRGHERRPVARRDERHQPRAVARRLGFLVSIAARGEPEVAGRADIDRLEPGGDDV